MYHGFIYKHYEHNLSNNTPVRSKIYREFLSWHRCHNFKWTLAILTHAEYQMCNISIILLTRTCLLQWNSYLGGIGVALWVDISNTTSKAMYNVSSQKTVPYNQQPFAISRHLYMRCRILTDRRKG
jgi:hypothetical protein